ncbi:hypothetical protein RRG08_034395 [Elysia crispata]|uniref:Uncharacterized protein n=1 Tax=Elysia crispata TaxID=231223 RepID=A0AAE0YCY7_9GAST|nr:hypothetical protein RRG08_034395 [Elysia crispata]
MKSRKSIVPCQLVVRCPKHAQSGANIDPWTDLKPVFQPGHVTPVSCHLRACAEVRGRSESTRAKVTCSLIIIICPDFLDTIGGPVAKALDLQGIERGKRRTRRIWLKQECYERRSKPVTTEWTGRKEVQGSASCYITVRDWSALTDGQSQPN